MQYLSQKEALRYPKTDQGCPTGTFSRISARPTDNFRTVYLQLSTKSIIFA
jgi:hypothetical protein